MSRAFVKEIDDAPPLPPQERSISPAPNRVTPRGARLIAGAVATLEQALAARPSGESASILRRDLRYWLSRQASMELVSPDTHPQDVGFGSRVTIRRDGRSSEIVIVGEDEAEPAEGRIAWTAPLAKALDGARIGDVVDLDAGGRIQPVIVVKVEAGDGGQ